MAHVLSTMVDQYFLLVRTPMLYTILPLQVPSTAWKAIQYHMVLPIITARINLGFAVPLDLRNILWCGNIGKLLYHNLSRCPEEIAAMPGQGQ